MTPMEILVGVGGLALGYWVVSRLMDDLNRDEKNPPGDTAQPESGPQPWHAVLRISPGATREEIRRAYEYLMDQFRPERLARLDDAGKEAATHNMHLIEAAYEQALRERGG